MEQMEKPSPLYPTPTLLSSSPIKCERLTASYAFVSSEYPNLHGHSNFCEILMVYKGTIHNYVNGQWEIMGPGDCCLIQKGDLHKFLIYNKDQEFLGINFLIREDYFQQIKELFGDAVARRDLSPSEQQRKFYIKEQETDAIYRKAMISQKLAQEDIDSFEITSKLLIIRLLTQYLEQIYDVKEQSVPTWILQLLADIQNPANMSKTLAQHIQNVPYCYSHIAKEFKKYMSCTLNSHITTVKLSYAMNLLETTKLSTLEICGKLGYTSLSHFNHTFKKYYGQSPSYYRKLNRLPNK